MSEQLLSELTEVLKKESTLYKKLLKIAEKKKETLVQNEIETLFDHVETDQELIDQVTKLENRRLEIMDKIDKKFDINSKELSYQDFINNTPDNWQDKLNPIREDLVKTLEEFHVLNEENKRLIEEAVKFNKFSIDLIVDNLKKNNTTYHSKDKNRPHLIDKRG
ncbi:MAG: flagellar protein FlgN [Halanaerobiales bacterium]|nr:flagellar protein FlgN [Halanaerobiales bacterium]